MAVMREHPYGRFNRENAPRKVPGLTKAADVTLKRGIIAAKYVAGPLDARSNDVAMEQLTLTYERLELE